jgi:glycosyltransferase involved in cell wall biosynthesis
MARRTQVVGLPESKIHVMPNPVDVTFWTSSPSEEQTFLKFPSIPYIFSHGRLATEKGYDLLIEGVARSGHNKRIVLAGEGPARTRLGELARHHGVPVEFLGWQSAIQLRTLLRRAEVAIYPSRYEPFSLAALEALLAAPHVLVSNRAGVLDFLPEDIVRRVSFEPAVDAIADALRRSNPPCLRPYPSLMIFGPEHVARTFVDSILRPVIHAM